MEGLIETVFFWFLLGLLLLFMILLGVIEISITLRRMDKRLRAITEALVPLQEPGQSRVKAAGDYGSARSVSSGTVKAESKLPHFIAQDDGGGRVLHADAGMLPFHIEYRSDGYYWQHLTGVPRGPFPTRQAAKEDEGLRRNR